MSLVAKAHELLSAHENMVATLVDECYKIFLEKARAPIVQKTEDHVKYGAMNNCHSFGEVDWGIDKKDYPIKTQNELRMVAPRLLQRAREDKENFGGITFECRWIDSDDPDEEEYYHVTMKFK